MNKFRSYVLPIAIFLGLFFHKWCSYFSFLVPFIIFSILLLSFSAVDIRRLRFSMLDMWLMLFQIVVSIGSYLLLNAIGVDRIVSEGVLIGVICPVACSTVVISCILGANRETVTAYTIIGNLMVAIVAPIYFSFIGRHQDMPFFESFWLILRRIGSIIGLPFFVAWALQSWFPRINSILSKHNGLSFYLWAFAFLFTMGQTFDFIFLHGNGNWHNIIWLGIAALFFCILQFWLGKKIGHHYGDTIAGGQLMGQKNSAMGIWMANYYLSPLASVFLAFYSIYQNVFNSWQMWQHERQQLTCLQTEKQSHN